MGEGVLGRGRLPSKTVQRDWRAVLRRHSRERRVSTHPVFQRLLASYTTFVYSVLEMTWTSSRTPVMCSCKREMDISRLSIRSSG